MNIDVGESPGPESWPTQQPPPPVVVLVAFLRAALSAVPSSMS
jgi:hypothetical protein